MKRTILMAGVALFASAFAKAQTAMPGEFLPENKNAKVAIAQQNTNTTLLNAGAYRKPSLLKAVPITFKTLTHSFGKIKQGTPVSYAFDFTNATAAPVVIESATAQCGCAKPKYPLAPVGKGTKEKIEVTYTAASAGSFSKQITVRVAKFTDPVILTIEGEVLAD